MSDTPTSHNFATWLYVPGVVRLWNTARVDGDRVILGCKVAKPMADGSTEISYHDTCVVYCANERQAIDYAGSVRP